MNRDSENGQNKTRAAAPKGDRKPRQSSAPRAEHKSDASKRGPKTGKPEFKGEKGAKQEKNFHGGKPAGAKPYRGDKPARQDKPFRSEKSLQRLLFHLHGFFKKQAILKDVSTSFLQKVLKRLHIARIDSLFISNRDKLELVNYCHPALFCVNDNEKSTDEDRARVLRFLEMKFPQRSPFEKDV